MANRKPLKVVATGYDADGYSDATPSAIREFEPTDTFSADHLVDGSTNKAYTGTEKTKLSGIATGATANDSDANLKARANHTGEQAISTVTGLQAAIDGKQAASPNLDEYAAVNPTAAGLALLDDVDAAAQRTTLGIDTTANQTDSTNKRFMSDVQEAKIDNITVTQAVDLDAIETRVNALDAAVVLKGTWDASAGTFPGSGTAQAGDSYIVSVGGTVDGQVFVANDRILAIADNASTTTYATNWHKLDYTDEVLSVNGQTGTVSITTITGNAGTATALQNTRNIDGQSFDGSANITVIAPGTVAAAGKTTPVDADVMPIADSEASNVLKKLTWANIKATLLAYFNSIYMAAATYDPQTIAGDAFDRANHTGEQEQNTVTGLVAALAVKAVMTVDDNDTLPPTIPKGEFHTLDDGRLFHAADENAFDQVLKASDFAGQIQFTIDGGGSVISAGYKGSVRAPFPCTITGWKIVADQSGDIVIDIWKDTYTNYPPDNTDSIAGTELPTLSATVKAEDTDLTTWTDVTVNAGDFIGFNVDSAATVTKVTVYLTTSRS